MGTRYTTTEELEALPDGAVIYDDGFEVWRHGVGDMTPRDICERLGTSEWNATTLWQCVGDAQLWFTEDIKLPARLLDDGL